MTLLAAAIKLGSSSAALAFSAQDSINGVRSMEEKPFCLLIGPDGKTLAGFGHEAVKMYANLKKLDVYTQYYYFTNIIQTLAEKYQHAENDVKKITIEDKMGRSLPALNVLTMAIGYLKKELKKAVLKDFKSVCFETDIYIVLTVPEVLQNTEAIELIRKAALELEIDGEMLLVITDFDAASVYYQHMHPKATATEKKDRRFLVVKAGARTETIVQTVEQNGQMKVVSPIRSYEFGGIIVDKAVEKVFIEIIGNYVWDTFKEDSPLVYLDLTRRIEAKKQLFCADTERLIFQVPFELRQLHQQITGKCLESIINSRNNGEAVLRGDKMRLSGKVVMVSIEEAAEKITSMIKATLRTSDVDAILMFGGFADSSVLQQIMQASLPSVNLVFHVNTLIGSVVLGHECMGKITVDPRTTMVAAIDFGTTYSGWASSLVDEFESDRTKAQVRKWHSGSTQTEKTPTCILIRPDGKTIEAFGYDAENRYRDLIEKGEHTEYFYFQQFKMLLNKKLEETIHREITLEDEMGRSLPAIDVFALSIKFLKEDVLLETNKRIVGGVREQDIRWVLTVPAIWTDGAKQFMREAAIKAGIETRRLTIALEPEAASIYCRHISVENTVGNTGISVSTFKAGTRYMILDTGGGTIDITVHEVDNYDGVKEVHSACGGGWGGTMVDKEFENMLIALLGKEVYLRFKREDTEDWLELRRDFEIKKRAVNPRNTSPIRMRLPISLIEIYKEHTGHRLENAVSSSEYAKDIECNKDKVKFSEELSRSFFQESINNTIRLVRNTLKDIQVKAILMVGGYSDSPMLQEAIRSTFIDKEVVVPLEASFSIMKGALIFGHLPKFVTERVLKYTYGICTNTSFVEGKHPESKRIHTDTGDKCKNIFSKHVEKNQSVKVGEPQVRQSYFPTHKQQKQIRFSVFASEILTPEYTDQNCHLVGEMLVALSDGGDLDREVQVALTFSDTEIVVKATEKKTGKETHVAIDFLG